jgi:hypothetical protein
MSTQTLPTVSLRRPARLLGLSGLIFIAAAIFWQVAMWLLPAPWESDSNILRGVATVVMLLMVLLVAVTFLSGLIWLGVNAVRRYI